MISKHLHTDLHLKFKHAWRTEQQRVLDNIFHYLDDKRIHIVAAPGAGKTVIGIEIFKQLRLKTLVVSPTRLIRNQWLRRLQDFLLNDSPPTWSGSSLSHTQAFTSTTYQGLFSLDKKISNNAGDQYECISQWFADNEIKILILDEAHHLKAAWWKVLMKFVKTNSDLIIISLTATPPYDASALEWSRYQQLCGPVDEHISIPELVKSNSLCPHQDYIWMVKTDDRNITLLKRHQQNLASFIDSLSRQPELLYLLQLHNWLNDDLQVQTSEVLYHLDECFALLGLLQLLQRPIPNRLLEMLGIDLIGIEVITVFGWETLLQSFIDGDHYPQAKVIDDFKDTFATLMSSKHFLRRNKVTLDSTKRKLEAFNKTQERIKACFDIFKVEYNGRKEWLRLVILSDFIRDEKFQLALSGLEAPTGAYPIFHYFIHHLADDLLQKTVLLTGRLSIVHKELISKVAYGLPDGKELIVQEYSEHNGFVILKNGSDELSAVFTDLHKTGEIITIIGTRSLLGEGWDAPHVNALIMATQTGAFVTTNQLRGRAIRIDTDDELKTASIWHIVAVASDSLYNKFIFQDLNKRFKTFAGLHAHELRIESGIQRLALVQDLNDDKSLIEQANHVMAKRHKDGVFNLQARWQNALADAKSHILKAGLQIDFNKNSKSNNLNRYITKIENQTSKKSKRLDLLTLAGISIAPLSLLFTSFANIMPFVLFAGVVTATSLYLKKRFTTRAAMRLRPDYYSKIFANIVLKSLHVTKQLQTQEQSLENGVVISKLSDGYYRYSLSGYTHKDNELFLIALSQLFAVIKRPRYIIALTKKPAIADIFPVPHIFGNNKTNAQHFIDSWKYYLPEFKYSHLIATASTNGKDLLLKVQASLYSQSEGDEVRLIDRWE